MAREVSIRTVDDLDKTLEAKNVETIGFRGFIYKLDLTDEHSDELVADLSRWLKAAHAKTKWARKSAVVKRIAQPAKKTAGELTQAQRQEARAWGRANGYEVATRGKLNPDLVKAYLKANRK
ncbi:histone-like nucleoid-structuring protein Lsr2 [Mycobacterium sp. AZCC_0083]|uniref:Lsr2 dimerization domain-containing protein n=1 Tax=Mycobacterium sp. AZCC_0083 TaxID=2735882 RepID=UPI001618E4B9|nr:histone-like nucleoid-structuring protein Lsr2 [Mycobacterium sp. AZCC_0083]MBB5167227.1 hypothetical protein [Mycobacterium sp. AZCC_0083]